TEASFIYTMPEQDITLTALFELKSYTITTQAQPDDGGTTTGDGQYEHGEQITLQATPATGYQFVNWTENGNEVSTDETYGFTVTEDRDLVAHFELKAYTINATANPEGGGTITGAGTYDHGEQVTLTASPETGYAFVNWTENGTEVSTDETYGFNATENRDLVAHFEQPLFEATFNTNLSNAIHFDLLSEFHPDVHEIYISGDMNDWAEPGSGADIQLMEKISEDPLVYSISFQLPAGTYEYKYFSDLIGDGWEGAEWDDMPDREVQVVGDIEINDMFGPKELNSTFPDATTINVYPNPANHWLHIESNMMIKQVQMFAISGQEVYQEKLNSEKHSFQVQNADPGLFLLRIHTVKGVETRKVRIGL
ncbi:MAG: T9SS type A sorting domain-containing protein, partial [Bacteroidales bacterium]